MRCCLAAFLSCAAFAAMADSTIGKTFPIAEPSFLDEIKSAAAATDWRQWMRRDPENYAAFDSTDLPSAKKDRSFLFDPTYSLPRDITDENGRVLYAKGTTINVYAKYTFPGRWIVIRPTSEQFKWLDEVVKPTANDKVLIAGGNVVGVIREHRRKVFILEPHTIERLGLQAVPSIVQQEGPQLRVQEYALD